MIHIEIDEDDEVQALLVEAIEAMLSLTHYNFAVSSD